MATSDQLFDSSPATASLTGIPPELVIDVIELLDPSDHLNLACTCRFLAGCSNDILQRHRDAHENFAVVTDLHPTTIPDLLNILAVDRIVAWHVRSLEIWGTRTDFPHLMAPDYDAFFEDPPSRTVSEDNFRRCRQALMELGLVIDPTSPEATNDTPGGKATVSVEDDDAQLKMLLMVLCPRLESVNYIKTPESMTQTNPVRRTPFNMLGPYRFSTKTQPAVSACTLALRASKVHPPKLQALKSVAIDIDPDFETERFPPRNHAQSIILVLRLPCIETAFFSGLYGSEAPYDWESLEPRSSTVKHLFFDNVDWHDNLSPHIARISKHLVSFAGRNIRFHTKGSEYRLRKEMREYQRSTLEAFLFYGPMHRRLDPGEECAIGSRLFCLDPFDLMSRCNVPGTMKGSSYMADALPLTVEAIVFWGPILFKHLDIADFHAFDDILADVIRSRRYVNLKAVYLGHIQGAVSHVRVSPNALVFQETLDAGLAVGVDVCIGDNSRPGLHDVDFPTPPDSQALASVRELTQSAPRPRVFNVYTGYWEDAEE